MAFSLFKSELGWLFNKLTPKDFILILSRTANKIEIKPLPHFIFALGPAVLTNQMVPYVAGDLS